MKKTIKQTVEFPGVSVRELFETYLNSKSHSEALGAPASMSDEVGGQFKVFGNNAVSGKNLIIVPDKMIVQTWRGQVWKANDLDSILVLTFEKTVKGAKIMLIQVNIPEQAYLMVNAKAWTGMYWRPWKKYFAKKTARS